MSWEVTPSGANPRFGLIIEWQTLALTHAIIFAVGGLLALLFRTRAARGAV